MKYDLYSDRLERRIAKLERLIYEKSVGRGGPSIAMNMWSFLMGHGPATKDEIEASLGPRYSNNPTINSYLKAGLITQNGNRYVANPDYNWDDVGPIPRTAQQELMHSIRSGEVQSAVNTPAEQPVRTSRVPRAPRAPRQREVKQNLFSKKFEEVKAAVDAGQDVNQKNDKGQTPLTFAANSKTGNNSDVIEYLLTHGADLSILFKGLNAFALVCKNSNVDAMRAILANDKNNVINKPSSVIGIHYKEGVPDDKDVILLAASKERDSFNGSLHSFYYRAYARRTISKEQYEQIISTMLDNCKYSSCSSESITREIANGITNTVKSIADKNGVLVELFWAVYNKDVAANIARELLDLCGEVTSGKIRLSYSHRALDFIDTCKMLCNKVGDRSFMSNLLNPQFLHSLDNSDLAAIYNDAVRNNNVATLSKMVAAKVKLSLGNILGSSLFDRTNASREITRLSTRLIDRSETPSRWVLGEVAVCKNEYLISYVIEMGYGEDLLAWCVEHKLTDATSITLKVLEENGFDIPDSEDSRNAIKNKMYDRQYIRHMTGRVIDAIKDDIWNREFDKFVTDHPEVLVDGNVAKAIEDSNTLTARQLRRRIERMPKDQDVYDM